MLFHGIPDAGMWRRRLTQYPLLKLFNVPEGYITGQNRIDSKRRTHLYKGTFDNPGLPMCRHGWNNGWNNPYLIWRNNVGPMGICKTCMKRARNNAAGVQARIGSEATRMPPNRLSFDIGCN